MNGEPIKFLKLSENPTLETNASEDAPKVIEDFLNQLDGEAQTAILGKLLSGESLVAKHGEATGRELAAYRLAQLMETIGDSATQLSDVFVFDVVVPEEHTTTDVELSKLIK